METVVKYFTELTLDELCEILRARAEVFIVEQNCAYQDVGEVDKEAYRVYIREEGKSSPIFA